MGYMKFSRGETFKQYFSILFDLFLIVFITQFCFDLLSYFFFHAGTNQTADSTMTTFGDAMTSERC